MSGDDTAQLIWFAGALILVTSGLAVRRIPMGEMVRMALIWLAIFIAIFMAIRGWQVGTGGG